MMQDRFLNEAIFGFFWLGASWMLGEVASTPKEWSTRGAVGTHQAKTLMDPTSAIDGLGMIVAPRPL